MRLDPNSIEYWLDLWRATYSWLERSAPEDAVFVCYEDLCSSREVWKRLAELGRVTAADANTDVFRPPRRQAHTDHGEASAIYDRLVARARNVL